MTVVVTGMGVLCATADNTGTFARALREGRVGIRPVDGATEGGLTAAAAANLPDFDFAALVKARAGPAGTLRLAARAPLPVRAAVVVALEAWEQAGLRGGAVAPDRIGLVVAGSNLDGRYTDELRPAYASSPVHLEARYALRYLDTDHVGTVSQVLGLTGEGYTVGGASASGNVAIINAARLIALGAVDVCLVLGALTDLSGMQRQSLVNLGAMAGRHSRPFDADHDGFVAGQAAAALVLESAGSARRRGATCLGSIAGYAQRLDANSLADPGVDAEAWVMATAVRRAGLEPGRIGYVNLHGTGSPLGDETEVKALHQVFGPDVGRPWLNSTKGLIGHCLCAAGVVEAVATLVQLRGGFLHPNPGLVRPIAPECRFVGATAERADVAYALSNSFGFGGIHTSVVLA